MKAVAVMQVLQTPVKKVVKDYINCLQRRLMNWRNGDLLDLLSEGRVIQSQLKHLSSSETKDRIGAKDFSKPMTQGRARAALHLLQQKKDSIPLQLDEELTLSHFFHHTLFISFYQLLPTSLAYFSCFKK